MNDPTEHDRTADEHQVETALREILGPLDRRLERFNMVLGLLGLATVVTVFLLLWLMWERSWWAALLWAAGAFFGLAMLMVPWEPLLVRPAVREFDRRFPEGAPERRMALAMLREMESPNKAEEKLHAAVTDTLPGERIVRKRRFPPLTQIEAALKPFRWGDLAPPRDVPHVSPGPPPAGPAGPQDGAPPEPPRPPGEGRDEGR